MPDEKKEIAVVEPQTSTAIDITRDPQKELEFGHKCAKALMGVVSQKRNPVIMNGEQYLEYEDWQTVGRFFGATSGTINTVRITNSAGDFIGYDAKAAVYDSKGVIISYAEASCLRDEPKWGFRTKYEYQNGQRVAVGKDPVPEFQLKSMAQTRACAKALRNAFAWVVVLAGYRPTPAEEMDGVITGTLIPAAPAPQTQTPKKTPAATAFNEQTPADSKPCKHCGTPINKLPTWRVLCLDCYRKDTGNKKVEPEDETNKSEINKTDDIPFN